MLKDRTQQFEHHSAMLQQQAILFNKIVKLFLPFLHYHQADNPSLSFSRSSPRLILIVMKALFYLCCAVSFCLFLSSNLRVNILRSISTHNRVNLTYYKSKCSFFFFFFGCCCCCCSRSMNLKTSWQQKDTTKDFKCFNKRFF